MAGHHHGIVLLERAIGYALTSVAAATPCLLSRSTPCAHWDLRALLHHVNDSLDVLLEAVETGRIGPGLDPDPDPADPDPDPAETFRDRAGRLLGACAGGGRRVIEVADRPLLSDIVAGTGAVEITVHGWDIAQACGRHQPIPPALAADVLAVAALVVTDATRATQFAAPMRVPSGAGPGDRLVALLGRRPIGDG